jgi:hypothetical protein
VSRVDDAIAFERLAGSVELPEWIRVGGSD